MSVAALLIPGLYNRHISVGLQTGDAAAPVYVNAPAAGAIGDDFLQVVSRSTDDNPPITMYIVTLGNGASAPSAAQIKAGTDSADAPAPNGSATGDTNESLTATTSGLSASTDYDVYYVVTDSFSNDQTVGFLNISTIAAASYDPQELAREMASGGERMVRTMVNDMVGT